MVLAYGNAAKNLRSGALPSHEGGTVYQVDKWAQLRRFLILGTQGGTFYVSEAKITRENAQVVLDCLTEDPIRTIAEIMAISQAGIAPKNDPAILALAMAASSTSETARKLATTPEAIAAVCRTGTHILHFGAYVNDMRGWGRGLKRGVASWYTTKTPDQLAFQAVKYRQRDGWTHRDLLRLAHPKTVDAEKNAVLHWIVSGENNVAGLADTPAIIDLYEYIQTTKFTTQADREWLFTTIAENNLPRELVPTQFLNDPFIQSALLLHMPPTALIRNLGNMSKSGLLTTGSDAARFVVEKLTNGEYLRQGRIHPMALLLALKTYQGGHGFLGTGAWVPVRAVVDALDAAFYASFTNITPTNKRIVLGIDISGSMQSGRIAGSNLSCAEAAVAMAMIVANTEPHAEIIGYTNNPVELTISPRQRMDDVMRGIAWRPLGTKCSVPTKWAMAKGIAADAIINITDNDTSDHDTHRSLLELRQHFGTDTIGVAMTLTSSGYSVYPDYDARVLNVVGLDASAPAVVADFIAS